MAQTSGIFRDFHMESAENSNSHSTYVSGRHTSSKPPSKQINQSINQPCCISVEGGNHLQLSHTRNNHHIPRTPEHNEETETREVSHQHTENQRLVNHGVSLQMMIIKSSCTATGPNFQLNQNRNQNLNMSPHQIQSNLAPLP